MPLSQVAAHARRAEALGYDGLNVPDAVHDGLTTAALALDATVRLHVATSVLVPDSACAAIAELESFRGAANRDPESAEAIAGQGAALYRKGEVDAARDLLEQATRTDSTRGPAHEWLGTLQLEAGEAQGSKYGAPVLSDAEAFEKIEVLEEPTRTLSSFVHGYARLPVQVRRK